MAQCQGGFNKWEVGGVSDTQLMRWGVCVYVCAYACVCVGDFFARVSSVSMFVSDFMTLKCVRTIWHWYLFHGHIVCET